MQDRDQDGVGIYDEGKTIYSNQCSCLTLIFWKKNKTKQNIGDTHGKGFEQKLEM